MFDNVEVTVNSNYENNVSISKYLEEKFFQNLIKQYLNFF